MKPHKTIGMHLRLVMLGMSHRAVRVMEGESGASHVGCSMALAIPLADEKCNMVVLLSLLALVYQHKLDFRTYGFSTSSHM